ncbi:hypothetical protein FQN55_001663 [Onygenales sp. PD_40]|nr:hypothetical protein FQN55_001663 [Onygenales sp. PD_40]KAK2767146.1 hypothetical protein FQN53_006574 [Emmonsiellopsis sp. PD_33]KAK2792780.1 hypothetical protein FQN52_002843 [Onygenales sp. PD_12]KAK2798893.1 hypothetical protein FQN51_007255 [Onygenales sp. PD_10]
MSARTPDKGRRYIDSLDAARCNGTWNDVPELARKIAKHAPERKCLIQVARAECHIADYINKDKRPSTSPDSKETKLHDLIPGLLSVMEEDGNFPQDVFQAQVCLGWLHWTLSEPALAASRLPKDFDVTLHMLSGDGQALSSWTEVCIIKGGYMKGAAQALVSGAEDALRTFKSVLPWVSAPVSNSPSGPQFLFWSEQLLAKAAMLSSEAATTDGQQADEKTVEFALRAFRLWAAHPEVKAGDPSSTVQSNAPASPGPRSSIWKAYYIFLSSIIRQEIFVSPSEAPKRVQLSTEFRRVEAICENILIRKTKFPKAEVANKEVEAWVEQVIQNWEILCGPDWRDDDFGEGGQDAFSRNVLDILYRAATKTFHSTLILRRLFHVHAALAEFNLAIKALETYIDLTTAARARAEKSPEAAGELEDNETFARTLAEGIMMLCCFGSFKEAEKSKQLADMLQELLDDLLSRNPTTASANGRVSPDSLSTDGNDDTSMSPVGVSFAYRAIGIGLANWARWTPVNENRTDIQAAALAALERSLASESEECTNVPATFAFGLLLAETRDLNGAIDSVRTALISAQSADDGYGQRPAHLTLSRERDLVPLWHLLALLLSAKQDFETASNACEAAFESVPSVNLLNGQDGKSAPKNQDESGEKSDHWLSSAAVEQSRGTPSEMEPREKESIVELRITQLSLMEIVHGPEYALNHSEELLSLFGRLFTNTELGKEPETKEQDTLAPPKSSAGTTRSIRGSIFGRRKSIRYPGSEIRNGVEANTIPRVPSTSSGHAAADADAPKIQVTDESRGESSEISRPGTTSGSMRHKLHRRDGSIKTPRPQNSDRSLHSTDADHFKRHQRQHAEEGSSMPGNIMPQTARHDGPSSAQYVLPPIPHHYKKQGKDTTPTIKASLLQYASQSCRFDSPTRAVTRFPKVQTQRHSIGLLIKIWLFVAGLYRRAALYEDALEACNEASNQAKRVELLVSGQESSARAFADAGWGGTKSSDELWADVYAERGLLAQEQSEPYDAMNHFEDALMYYPDHPSATVGLANLLLDIYDKSLPAEKPEKGLDTNTTGISLLSSSSKHGKASQQLQLEDSGLPPGPHAGHGPSPNTTPEALNRLAARDRAYGLLSTLTKLGTAWDNSEAWFALSRAFEQSGQIDKAKEVLWWCVELEDRRPIRHWWNVGSGGYVL